MKKILLFTPPYNTGIIEVTGTWPTVGLLYVAGAIREAGHEVKLCDLMANRQGASSLLELIDEWKPDAVLTGSFTPSINAAVETLKEIKHKYPDIVTILGGVHASLSFNELLNSNGPIDFIVIGEGEETCPELLRALNKEIDIRKVKGLAWWEGNQIVKTDERPLLVDLDVHQPAWDLLDWSLYHYRITDSRLAIINTSRGCNNTCRFCSQHLFWRGCYRARSPQKVVEEIMLLKNTYGVQMCMIADEYPTYDRQRWEEILDRLIEVKSDVYITLETRAEDILRDVDILDKYKQAGVIHVYVGIEAINQANLDYLGKNLDFQIGRQALDLLNNAGIITECSFIIGSPEETIESIEMTLKQALVYNPDLAHFLLLTPWPYTELYKEVEEYIVDKDLSHYHFVHPIIKPKHMEIDTLWDKLIACFKEFYINKAMNIGQYSDPFKRNYMVKSMEIMYNDFFKKHFGQLKIMQSGGDDMVKKWDEKSVSQLDKDIADFMDNGLMEYDDVGFNELALKTFEMQYELNDYYRKYCQQLSVDPDNIKDWQDIPAIPTKAFRENIIASFPLTETEISLLTSGTTDPNVRGKIYRDKGSLNLILKANYMLSKEFLFPDLDKMRILLLVPSPKVAPGMPMAFGLEQARKEFGTEDSEYFITPQGLQTEELIKALKEAEAKNEPVCFLGATSGYVYFFNECRNQGIKFNLPQGSRACDGGGYQGTFGPCSRQDFYKMVKEFLNIPEYMCVNILGMGESGTNYFDNSLNKYTKNKVTNERFKVVPCWTRTVILGVRTGKPLPQGEIGLIRHYDLTNRATVLAVQTDNLGYETDDGFEIVGRANPQMAGLGVESYNGIKDWVLGAGHDGTEAKFYGPPHGMPCSTVADGMMKGQPHGMPCSTVADGMMKGHPHGMPCSTVADAMMKKDIDD